VRREKGETSYFRRKGGLEGGKKLLFSRKGEREIRISLVATSIVAGGISPRRGAERERNDPLSGEESEGEVRAKEKLLFSSQTRL